MEEQSLNEPRVLTVLHMLDFLVLLLPVVKGTPTKLVNV